MNIGVAFGFLLPFLKIFQKQSAPDAPETTRENTFTLDVNAAEGSAIPDPSQRFFEFGSITVFDPQTDFGTSRNPFEQIYDPSSDRFDLELEEFNLENNFDLYGEVELREDWVFADHQIVMFEYASKEDDFSCYVLDAPTAYRVLDDAEAVFLLLVSLIAGTSGATGGELFDQTDLDRAGVGDDQNSVLEGSTVSVSAEAGVLNNDSFQEAIGTISVVSFALEDTSVAAGFSLQGTYGTLTLEADGSYSYVADTAAAEALDAGDVVTDVFTYTVS
ncbi:hypothetical protein LSUCC1028_11450, partial [Rhodobacterales bacterium LSUCC1028]|nr:hypothetical protein [Rhodobacterales bacterium LSUCC1028]